MLNVTPAMGGAAIATAVNASIDAASLDSFAGGTYTGNIRFTPNAVGQIPFDLPVTINITRTRVNFVAPHVAVAASLNEVIIRGEFFNAVQPTGVLSGPTPATSFTLVSGTEIRATHPALPVGAHTVHVNNAQGIDRTTAVLHVIDAGAMPAASLDYPAGVGAIPLDLIYDARRSALLVNVYYPTVGLATNQIVRYAYAGGSWQQTARNIDPLSQRACPVRKRQCGIRRAWRGGDVLRRRARSCDACGGSDYTRLKFVPRRFLDGSGERRQRGDRDEQLERLEFLCGADLLAVAAHDRADDRPGGRVTIPPMRQHSGATVASGDGSSILIGDTQNQRAVRYVSGDLEASWFDPTFAVNRYFLQLVMKSHGQPDDFP